MSNTATALKLPLTTVRDVHKARRLSKGDKKLDKKSASRGHSRHLVTSDDENDLDNETINSQEDGEKSQNQPSVRNILGFMEKYDRVETQELLSQLSCHWLLSLDDFKVPIEHPQGIITQMTPISDGHLLILLPFDETIPELDYREMHQILRELTIGIYVLNQHPSLQLEANFDESTSCQMPPAYIDTKLGQIMINTDYWLKALWHGAYFSEEKRKKFAERYRLMLDVDANGVSQTKKDLFAEFITAGLADIARDEDYGSIFRKGGADDSAPYPFGVGMILDQQTKLRGGGGDLTEKQKNEGEAVLLNCIDDVSLQLTFGLKEIRNFKNLYEIESDYFLNTCCKANNEVISNTKYESIKPILNLHERFLRENFEKKTEVRENLVILKFVSFLVPLLISLKKRMLIPDMNNLLPPLTGEEVHTERELPPLMYSADFKSKLFSGLIADQNKYFNLHGGIQFQLETTSLDQTCADEFENEYAAISSHSSTVLKDYLEAEQMNEYKVPVIEIKNKKFWSFKIDLESYYSQYPQKPYWLNKLNDELVKLKPKRLPVSDIQIYDLFKKHFGYKKATKFKGIPSGLRASSERGLIGVFQSFLRRTPQTRLTKHDEFGYGLLHYAAIYNRPLIISTLSMASVDINIRQQVEYLAIGPMPVHYAARCNSLDSLTCLLATFANLSSADADGWAPIHHACYFDNVPVINILLRKQKELVECTTRGEWRRTPLLIAASAGALESVKCLISHGANVAYCEENGYNLIHMAVHKNRTNIIDYFIKVHFPQLPTWKLLINMLSSDKEMDIDASVKCMHLLTNSNKKSWLDVLNVGGIEKLFAILRKYSFSLIDKHKQIAKNKEKYGDDYESSKASFTSLKMSLADTIALNSMSVLCNLSDQYDIKVCLNKIADLTTVLIKILKLTTNEDVQSRVAILIGDVSSADENVKVLFAKQDCLFNLLNLLNSDFEDLLVNAINTIEIMCRNNVDNQNFCSEHNAFECFISLLNLNSDILKASVSAAVAALTHENYKNQMQALRQGIITPICDLLKSRNITVQLKASLAIEAMATNNQNTQDVILDLEVVSCLIRLLEDHTTLAATIQIRKGENLQCITLSLEYSDHLHNRVATLLMKHMISVERMYYVGATIKSNIEDWSIIVREQSALTLWALAGSLKPQRKFIAEKIGTQQIINMVMAKSEKLQFVGSKCMISLVIENKHYQNIMLRENGIEPLIKLLRMENISQRVKLSVVETIGALCVDIAHVNNSAIQANLAEKNAINYLIEILHNPTSKLIQVEATHALACMLLNKQSDEEVNRNININLIIELIKTEDLELRLKAGLAIAVLAYNNHQKQFEIKKNGGISYEWYKVFYEDETINPLYLCWACFQVVILARVINDRSQVWLTAIGVSRLVELLLHSNDQVVIQTASYMSSLAHSGIGITDAMISCDAVDILCDRLYSRNEEIRYVSAVALGYLTFNRKGSRILLNNCRNVTDLFDTLMSILKPDDKIGNQFVQSYRTALQLGLPKLLVNKTFSINESENKQREFVGFYKGRNRNFGVCKVSPMENEHNFQKEKVERNNFKIWATRSQSAPNRKIIQSSYMERVKIEQLNKLFKISGNKKNKHELIERPKTHHLMKRSQTDI